MKRSDGIIGNVGEGRNRNGQKVFLPIIAGTAKIGIIGMTDLLRCRTAKQPGHGLLQGQQLRTQHKKKKNRYDLAGLHAGSKIINPARIPMGQTILSSFLNEKKPVGNRLSFRY